MKGLALMRAIDWRTSSSGSSKASAAHSGLIPVSAWIWRRKSSSVKVSMPQSVWWMRMISSVPSRRWEIASDRISSSVTTPPALRITCASPSLRPRSAYGLSRASMQARTTMPFAGGIGRSPRSNVSAYRSALARSSSVTLMAGPLPCRDLALPNEAITSSIAGCRAVERRLYPYPRGCSVRSGTKWPLRSTGGWTNVPTVPHVRARRSRGGHRGRCSWADVAGTRRASGDGGQAGQARRRHLPGEPQLRQRPREAVCGNRLWPDHRACLLRRSDDRANRERHDDSALQGDRPGPVRVAHSWGPNGRNRWRQDGRLFDPRRMRPQGRLQVLLPVRPFGSSEPRFARGEVRHLRPHVRAGHHAVVGWSHGAGLGNPRWLLRGESLVGDGRQRLGMRQRPDWQVVERQLVQVGPDLHPRPEWARTFRAVAGPVCAHDLRSPRDCPADLEDLRPGRRSRIRLRLDDLPNLLRVPRLQPAGESPSCR